MKALLFSATLFIALATSAQTDVIALKSHSGKTTEIHHENSNFGLDESMLIDSVIYIGHNCYVEIRNAWDNFQSRDTICDNPYFKEHGYSHESAVKAYRSRTVIIGFKKPKTTIDPARNWNRTNNTYLFVGALFLLSLLYIVRPSNNK